MSYEEDWILERTWFYEFTLPSGKTTRTNIPPDVLKIHTTRLAMTWPVLEAVVGPHLDRATCIDFASHEGFFSIHLAQRCKFVRGFEHNAESLEASRRIAAALRVSNLEFIETDVNDLDPGDHEPADIVLMYGLLYHLENPVGVLRKAAALTRQVLIVETQTIGVDLGGSIDWGCHLWQKELQGAFGVTGGDPKTREGGTSDIVLVPSRKALTWILGKLGFSRIEVVSPPGDAYEQLLTGRRIMVAAYR